MCVAAGLGAASGGASVGASELCLECRSKRVECGQAVPKASEVNGDRDRRSSWCDHGKLALVAPEAVVHLDQRGEAARVDEGHVAEIDHKPHGVPISRVQEGGAKVATWAMSSSPSGAIMVVSGNERRRPRRRPDGTRSRTRRWSGRGVSAPTHEGDQRATVLPHVLDRPRRAKKNQAGSITARWRCATLRRSVHAAPACRGLPVRAAQLAHGGALLGPAAACRRAVERQPSSSSLDTMLSTSRAEAVPGHSADAEHLVVVGDAV